MSGLFGVQRPAITKHLKNIFDSNELEETSVSSTLEHTAEDGKKYKTTFYNLDAIIAVGYRVNSNKDYFDELLEQIREIRASERRFYQKITDLHTLSMDYDKTDTLTKDFFTTITSQVEIRRYSGDINAAIAASEITGLAPFC